MVTRRISIVLLSLFLSVVIFAANKDLEKDITMVSYEQGWMDSYGTLALKNNSGEEIRNVVFMITYLDMSGKELDYEEFTKDVTIAPGKTKKLDIPAYEWSRHYHYYKSEGSITGSSPSFKIEFKLKDYNTIEEAAETVVVNPVRKHGYEQSDGTSGRSGSVLLLFVMIIFILGVAIGSYVLVALMAKNRNRNVVVWILLSLVTTPLLMMLVLLIVGRDNSDFDHYERK